MAPKLRPIALVAILASLALSGEAACEPTVAGWVENAWIGDPAIKLEAKLDTGAKSSSINATTYEAFTRNGAKWVRFSITNKAGERASIEKTVVRNAKIRRSGVDTVSRPVVMLTACIAGYKAQAEFTISDRTGMDYQILIGRTFLADAILVDSGRTFLGADRCKGR